MRGERKICFPRFGAETHQGRNIYKEHSSRNQAERVCIRRCIQLVINLFRSATRIGASNAFRKTYTAVSTVRAPAGRFCSITTASRLVLWCLSLSTLIISPDLAQTTGAIVGQVVDPADASG